MHKVFLETSADDIIPKVYDIQAEEREEVQRLMVLCNDTSNCEDASNCFAVKEGEDWGWLRDDYPEDVELLMRVEGREQKAAEKVKIEPVTINKIFRE